MIGARRSTNGGSSAEAGRRSLRAGRVLAGVSIAAMLVAGLLPNAAPAAASPIAAMVPGATVDSARLAQMMPRFVQQPKVKGRFLTFGVRVHPWRTSKRNTASKPDRMGGQVWISKPKTSLRGSSSTVHKARALGHPNRTIIMTHRTLPIRTITKDGVKTYRVKLPLKVARSLSGLSRAQLAKRVDVQMWNDKDILAGVPGSDLRQHASAFPPGTLPKAKKSSKQRGTGARGTAGRQSVRSAPMDNNNNGISTQKNTPGNLMIFNGSPFDMTYNVAELSCMSINNSTGALTTGTLAAGASAQYSMVGYPNGGDGTNYDSDAPTTGASAWNTIASQAAANISTAVGAGIAGGYARPKGTSFIAAAGPVGLATFGAGLLLDLIKDAISASNAGNGCQDGGSAFSVNWTVKGLSSSQTPGNISYWVPSYGSSTPVESGGGSVTPTQIPVSASGSTVNAYFATSANGLALSAPVLQTQVGLSGSLVLETSNGGNAAFNTGKWAGCDFSNQQSGNPNSSNPSAPYGLSGFSGGVTADWGPCVDWVDEIDCKGMVCPDTVAESVTVLLGYSNTAAQVGGAGPYAVQPTTMNAASPEACAALDAPCIAAASSPGNSGTAADGSLTIGCTLGDWNIYAPWSPTSFSLTNAPSAYQEQSQMITQLGYVAMNSSGKVALAQVPASVEGGGATMSGFDANVPNSFTLNSADLTAIEQSAQQSLGQGAYVAQWVCAMTSFSTVPTLANALGGANQPSLGWYGSAVYAAIENPAGNMLSKVGSTTSAVGSTSGAPSGVNAVAGNGQVVVSWNPVTAASGAAAAPEVAYTATASSGQSCTSAGLTCTISGVPNGSPVTVTVTATAGGNSATSPPTSPVTPQSSASTPSPTSGAQNVTVNASNNTINVAWNPAKTIDGAKAPVSYTAISSTGQSCTTTGTACAISGVPAGVTPQVRVVTTTSQGYAAPASAGWSSSGATPSPLEVSDSTPGSAKARSILKVRVKAGPGAADGKATITLMRGDKVVARLGTVTVINGSGVNKVKIPKKVKKGNYKLAVSFVDQETGQIGNTSSAIRIKKKGRNR